METPDVTKAQVISIAQTLVALATSVGLDEWLIVAFVVPLAVAQVLADALIRYGRSKVAANPQAMLAQQEAQRDRERVQEAIPNR